MTDKPRHILDMGCGGRPKPDATHSIDINPVYVKDKPNGKVWDMNNLPFPYPDGYFDKIYCCDVLEHLDVGFEAVLLELRRILKFHGVLVVSVPNCMWWYHRICYLIGYIPQDFFLAHRKHFTRGYVYNALDNCGFKIKAKSNFPPKLNFMGSGITIKARKFE